MVTIEVELEIELIASHFRSFQELIRRCFAGVLWGAQAIDNVGVDDVAAFSFIQAAVDSSSKHS